VMCVSRTTEQAKRAVVAARETLLVTLEVLADGNSVDMENHVHTHGGPLVVKHGRRINTMFF